MSFYSGAKKIFAPIFRGVFRITVTGKENFPKDGGVIVCANHTNMLDVAALAASFDRQFYFMAKKETFAIKPLGALFRKLGAYPVNRGGVDVKSLKYSISLLEEGKVINIFPQGTRRKKVDPSTTPIKNGIGMIAYHSKCCTILPIFIKTKNNHLHFFGKTELIVGEPFDYDTLCFEKGGAKEYEHASRLVFSKICALGGYDFPVEMPEVSSKNDGVSV